MGVTIFIEGDKKKSSFHQLRLGFQEFFRTGLPNHKLPKIEMCGSRKETYEDFCNAIKKDSSNFHILLVDSEGPVTKTPWKHLWSSDKWKNCGSSDENCHLMVQMMESWFYADVATLIGYYGKRFVGKHIPKTTNVEVVAKRDVEHALKMATRNTKMGEYHKIQHASELLQKLDVTLVRSKAQHCDDLFNTLQNYLKPHN